MRAKRIVISGELFCQLFTRGVHHGYRVIEQAIPDDAYVRNARLGWPDGIELLIESASFDPVREGDDIPVLNPLLMNGVHAEVPDA